MNVLILGSGGREHALARAVSKSKLLNQLFVIPGNPGIYPIAKCIDLNPFDNDKIKGFCINNDIQLVIPGSEVYLENGIADSFQDTNIAVFGPTKNAAKIESSKEYAKDLMKKYHIPTAKYEVFTQYEQAVEYVKNHDLPIVLKYDGLAGGKGVVICNTLTEVLNTLDQMLNQKIFGNGKVVIEEYLEGPEFSFMTFVHNDTVIPMPIAQDHKRLLDNDLGPNTGGMGIYTPVPIISDSVIQDSLEEIMVKTVQAMTIEQNPFTGFLYGGLMVTDNGPKVIEFNARFGDPEAEVILPKLDSDILEVILSLLDGNPINLSWNNDYFLGVVMASKDYPNKCETGFEIHNLEELSDMVYHMGTKYKNDSIITNGGRVLLVIGRGKSLEQAKQDAYANVQKIKCENLIYRNDIGHKSLKGLT